MVLLFYLSAYNAKTHTRAHTQANICIIYFRFFLSLSFNFGTVHYQKRQLLYVHVCLCATHHFTVHSLLNCVYARFDFCESYLKC